MDVKKKTIDALRILSAEGVEKANSGHPGTPMGAAPIAYTLFGEFMNYNPADPKWDNRDRFILSAGHGSMLDYSILHLFNYGLTVEDLANFRQLDSKTPGHPEYGHTVGIETTTGPLGQGIATSVGMAMAEAHLADKFNKPGFDIVDHYTYVICGDGCMMEGISSEAGSLAGTLGLNKLIVFYDDNEISIEGNTDIAFREHVDERFAAFGWNIIKVSDVNDLEQLSAAVAKAKTFTNAPTLIVCKSVIGYGSPVAGTAGVHGAPLGAENLKKTKEFLGWEADEFFKVPAEVYAHTKAITDEGAKKEEAWKALFAKYEAEYPELAAEYKQWMSGELPVDLANNEDFWTAPKAKDASRNSSGVCLNKIAALVPNMFGGSADLAPSNKSNMKGAGDFSKEDRSGKNLHFGVREAVMASIGNGIALHGGLFPYVATFFVFSDYMKGSMRLSALMKQPVTYILTHDSIGVGEDGPTHQPIEQLAALRSIPGFNVMRPCDYRETAAAWYCAMTKKDGPTALVLTRQNMPCLEGTGMNALKGAYVLRDSEKPQIILMASGSEVELCWNAYDELAKQGIAARVVSVPSMELFDAQPDEYKESVFPKSIRARLAVEAGSTMPWYKYVGLDGAVIGLDHFGASAPFELLAKRYGFTLENVMEKALALVK